MTRAIVILALFLAACERGGLANPNTAPDAQSHQKYFPIASGAHGGVDCNSCHGAFDSFAQFDCLTGCHAQADTDPAHSTVVNYKYASADCYSCHPTGTGVDHNQFFPVGSGTKHDLDCTSCHTTPNDHSQFSCVSGGCHPQSEADSDHRDVGGYMYVSANCYGCHFRGAK